LKAKIQTILVTGADGQLGKEFQALAQNYPNHQFLFATKEKLSIDDPDALSIYFNGHSIEYCINCAAYTAVDKAESEAEQAFLINAEATANLAKICLEHEVKFIHISTDYVFDGSDSEPYKETDPGNTLNVYGESKLKGEELALKYNPTSIIVRTSWLYSSYKNNFVKTMLRLMSEKESINVVNDQFGSPTYAADLASAIMKMIRTTTRRKKQGIYHYANAGVTSWYEFALLIKQLSGSNCEIRPIPTTEYPTAAKRPMYTVLDTTKIRETFKIDIPAWQDSLKVCLEQIKNAGTEQPAK
jgi:dTDP-4-dehydrorhamnose reductase